MQHLRGKHELLIKNCDNDEVSSFSLDEKEAKNQGFAGLLARFPTTPSKVDSGINSITWRI